MKVCILMGSPRKQGNTNALLGPFRQELEGLGAETETVWLHALEIRPCTACRACQRDWTAFGCAQRDDVPMIFDKVLACDLIVLATPIYSWYCTPPMKAVMDRLIYAPNKYYGPEGRQPALWKLKQVAAIASCGYHPDHLGMLCRRDFGPQEPFMNEERDEAARDFAHALYLTVSLSL